MLIALLLVSVRAEADAGGAAPRDPPPPEALALLSAGDLAWWRGDRRTAFHEWQAALHTPDPGPRGRATEAMARIRLLQLSGTFGPFVHEGKLNRALADCPTTEPWCAIAAADWNLFMPAFTGADPAEVPALLADSPLVGPAAARIAIATKDTRPLDALPVDALDGMGLGIREARAATSAESATADQAAGAASATPRPTDPAAGLRPPTPGTWVLGIGVGGAPGAGVGLSLRFVHPDLAWKAHRLELVGGGDTRGGALLSGTLFTASHPAFIANATVARSVADRWVDDTPTPYTLGTVRGALAVAPRWGPLGVQLGGSARADMLDGDTFWAAGPSAAVSIGDAADAWMRIGVDSGFGSYTHAAVSAEARMHPTVAGGTLALRAAITTVPTRSPFFRLPTAGGTDVLRGLPAGRFRDDTVFAGQLEYRHAIWGPLHAALFVDTARVEGWHYTVGGGVRIVLPPDRFNVTRLDVGFGPEGWGVVAAWGEAF